MCTATYVVDNGGVEYTAQHGVQLYHTVHVFRRHAVDAAKRGKQIGLSTNERTNERTNESVGGFRLVAAYYRYGWGLICNDVKK